MRGRIVILRGLHSVNKKKTAQFLMEYNIWRHLIKMLSYQNFIIDAIKPFFKELTNSNNHEIYNINDEKHIPFLRTFSKFELKALCKYEIIYKETYEILVPKRDTEELLIDYNHEAFARIIRADNLEELRILIQQRTIGQISPIRKSFNELENMEIPLIHECIIDDSICCFKYLVMNEMEDLKTTMRDLTSIERKKYEWDCMAVAIYSRNFEIESILKQEGIKEWRNPAHFEAAIFAYRNWESKKKNHKN